MRKAEFDALLTRLYPAAGRLLAAGTSRPQVCNSVIQHLWLTAAPESEDTAALRRQMQHLDSQGRFDLTD